MANGDASSATVKVTSSSARTSAIHKEKFNVPPSSDEPIDLSNIVKHLNTFTRLVEIAQKLKVSEKKNEVMIVVSFSFIILRYKKLRFLFRVNSKYQSKGLIYSLCTSQIDASTPLPPPGHTPSI